MSGVQVFAFGVDVAEPGVHPTVRALVTADEDVAEEVSPITTGEEPALTVGCTPGSAISAPKASCRTDLLVHLFCGPVPTSLSFQPLWYAYSMFAPFPLDGIISFISYHMIDRY